MKKILATLLLTLINFSNIPVILSNITTSTNQIAVNLSSTLKTYFQQTIIPAYNLKHGQGQIYVIIMKILKKLNPENYEEFKIQKLELQKNSLDSNKTTLLLTIDQNDLEILNEQYVINFNYLVGFDATTFGNIVYTQQIEPDKDNNKQVFIISKTSGDNFQVSKLTIGNKNGKMDNILSILKAYPISNTNKNRIFSFVKNDSNLESSYLLRVFGDNNHIEVFNFSIEDTKLSFEYVTGYKINLIQNDDSYIYNDNFDGHDLTFFTGIDQIDNKKISIVHVSSEIGLDHSRWVKYISMGNIVTDNYISLSNGIALIIGINSDDQWIAYTSNYIDSHPEKENKAEIKIPILESKLIKRIIHWDNITNTLSYVIEVSGGQKLEIINIDSNQILYSSPIINDYFVRHNNADNLVAEFNYKHNALINILDSNKQVLTKHNEIMNISGLMNNKNLINITDFSFVSLT